MRYVIARKEHKCLGCKGIIDIGEVCIQSQNCFGQTYHEECHKEKFRNSIFHKPKNEKPKGVENGT